MESIFGWRSMCHLPDETLATMRTEPGGIAINIFIIYTSESMRVLSLLCMWAPQEEGINSEILDYVLKVLVLADCRRWFIFSEPDDLLTGY